MLLILCAAPLIITGILNTPDYVDIFLVVLLLAFVITWVIWLVSALTAKGVSAIWKEPKND
jgi:hypothetical protein